MATRFTNFIEKPARRQPRSFEARRQMSIFLSAARAELAMICAVLVVFWSVRANVDQNWLVGALLVACALGTYVIRQSSALARVVFLSSIIAAEMALIFYQPLKGIPMEWMAMAFLALDIGLFAYFATKTEEE